MTTKYLLVSTIVLLAIVSSGCASPTPTPVPPTATPQPTATRVPPTATPVPPTATATVVVPTATPTVGQIFIEGVYYYSRSPGDFSFLRFFKDGTVLNGGDSRTYANIQAAWVVWGPRMTLQNANAVWHGKYTIIGTRISFGTAPPGQSEIVANSEGTYQPDKLTLKIGAGPTIYEFIRADVGN